MRNPRPVEAVAGLALLVGTDLLESDRIHLGIAAVWNERRHAADRVSTAAMTGCDQQLGVCTHERRGHRHLVAVGEHEIGPAAAEELDHAEQVVPPTGIESGRVVAQFVQNLFHLEGGRDCLDEDGGADGAVGHTARTLREPEDVVPQSRFEVALHLWQVVVRPAASFEERLGVVEEVEAEVHERRNGRSPAEAEVRLIEVPPPWSHDHGRESAVSGESVRLAIDRGEVQRFTRSVFETDLARDHVGPARRVRVLEVSEPHPCAGVERVDGHFWIGRPGDLHAPIPECERSLCHGPLCSTDFRGLIKKSKRAACRDSRASGLPCLECGVSPRSEVGVQLSDECESLLRENLVGAIHGTQVQIGKVRRGHYYLSRQQRAQRASS